MAVSLCNKEMSQQEKSWKNNRLNLTFILPRTHSAGTNECKVQPHEKADRSDPDPPTVPCHVVPQFFIWIFTLYTENNNKNLFKTTQTLQDSPPERKAELMQYSVNRDHLFSRIDSYQIQS